MLKFPKCCVSPAHEHEQTPCAERTQAGRLCIIATAIITASYLQRDNRRTVSVTQTAPGRAKQPTARHRWHSRNGSTPLLPRHAAHSMSQHGGTQTGSYNHRETSSCSNMGCLSELTRSVFWGDTMKPCWRSPVAKWLWSSSGKIQHHPGWLLLI